MTWLVRILLVLCAVCAAAPQDVPAADVFSGNVSEFAQDSITVVRKLPAKVAVSRRFTRDAQTKVEGSLKVSARVSVRFETLADGQFHALHVLVR